MVSKGPDTGAYQQQMQQQQMMFAAQLRSEQAAYQASLDAQRQQAAAQAALDAKKLNSSVKRKAAMPVKLGTLLTSSTGLLGNPVLSATKLS